MGSLTLTFSFLFHESVLQLCLTAGSTVAAAAFFRLSSVAANADLPQWISLHGVQ